MHYLAWNDCLARHFFSPAKEGQPVYLCLDRDLIVRLGQDINPSVDLADFLDAIRMGPPWASGEAARVGRRALASIRGDWRKRQHPPLLFPPYFAYLALFVAAASLEGEWSSNAYYPRLRQLLGEPTSGNGYPDFDEMGWLWEDLEKWSIMDKGGQWGIFRHFLYGSWKHVGLPIAQTLLPEDDRRVLPTLFALNGLDPQSPPNDDEFLSILAKSGEENFRPRTLSLLRSTQAAGGHDARQALATLLFAELRDWDGTLPQNTHLVREKEPQGSLHQTTEEQDPVSVLFPSSSGTIRLSCKFDPVSGSLSSHLRCKTPSDFPEDGFRFRIQGDGVPAEFSSVEILGEERGGGWSEPLKRFDTRRVFDAPVLDWGQPLSLLDTEQSWNFRWRGAIVRLLVDAQSEGLSGYIEVFRLALHAPILVFVHSSLSPEVDNWGRLACNGWKPLPSSAGLPLGWSAFSADAVREDVAPRAPHSILCPPSSFSILLRGGIRAGSGNQFFDFALPQIEVQGVGKVLLSCNDKPLLRGENGTFLLPEQAKDGLRLEAKLCADGSEETVARLALYVVHSQWGWNKPQPQQWFDVGGIPCSTQTGDETVALVAGAAVEAQHLAPFHFGGVIPIMAGGTVHFLGRVPGQISRGTQRPQGWEPVWAIVSRQKGRAYFCALDATNASPIESPCARNLIGRRELREWCDWIYTRRKDISPPTESALRTLWSDYIRVAQKLR